MWKDNKELPEIDREVVALQSMKGGLYKVVYAHRPNPNGYVTVNGEKLYAQTYGEGGWNIPNIVWWLDLNLPYKF